MPKFIILKMKTVNGNDVFPVMHNCCYFEQYDERVTHLVFNGGDSIAVLHTPEEIIEMLRDAHAPESPAARTGQTEP